MATFDLGAVLNVIGNAKAAIATATKYMNDLKESGLVMNSVSEAEVEAAIDELEAMLPELRQATQDKLRGTKG